MNALRRKAVRRTNVRVRVVKKYHCYVWKQTGGIKHRIQFHTNLSLGGIFERLRNARDEAPDQVAQVLELRRLSCISFAA